MASHFGQSSLPAHLQHCYDCHERMDDGANSIVVRQSARVDNFTLLARISEVLDLVTEQIHGSGATSSLIQENTSRQDRRLESIEASLADLKEMVTEISNTSVSQQILASNSQYLRSLDPTREMPIWFEDALRCKLKLPIEWISDWKVSNNQQTLL